MGFEEILITVVKNIANLLPRRTVKEWQRGIHIRRGKIIERNVREYENCAKKWWQYGMNRIKKEEPTENLPAGVYWFIPLLDEFIIEDVNDEYIEASIQDIDTSDGKPIMARAAMSYKISSLPMYYRNMQAPDQTIPIMLKRAAAQEIESRALEDGTKTSIKQARIRNPRSPSDLEKSLTETVTKEAEQYGIDVHWAAFLDLTSVQRTHRFAGSSGNPFSNGYD